MGGTSVAEEKRSIRIDVRKGRRTSIIVVVLLGAFIVQAVYCIGAAALLEVPRVHWWAPIVAAAAMVVVIAVMICGKGRRAVRAPLTAACAALVFIILNALLAELSAAFAAQVPVSLGGIFERIFYEFILTYEAWAAFAIALVAAALATAPRGR